MLGKQQKLMKSLKIESVRHLTHEEMENIFPSLFPWCDPLIHVSEAEFFQVNKTHLFRSYAAVAKCIEKKTGKELQIISFIGNGFYVVKFR